MEKNEARYSFLVDRELLAKFKYVADYNGRSMAKEFMLFLRRSVKAFEGEYGEIPVGKAYSQEE